MKFFIYTSFLFFCGIINSFSTEEEEIKCCSCKEIVITITKNNKNEEKNEQNYTIKAPFASLSCIFNCECNSLFLCKNCYKKKKIDKCPTCKKTCNKKCNNENNEEQSLKNTNNDNENIYCSICYEAYIKTSPLSSCSYFYNCICNGLICKKCYEGCIKKDERCPVCRQFKNEENNHNVTNEENKIIEVQKNCCQICIEWIKDC